jgi:nicotinamidase-related amidase
VAEAAFDYARNNHIAPSESDEVKVVLMPIDVQRDFCFPEGALFVAGRSGQGAIDDSRRLAEFIYRELPNITTISPTLDTHEPFQIFSPMFWRDEKEMPLLPHDMIDGDLIIQRGGKAIGRALPSLDIASMLDMSHIELVRQVSFYVKQVLLGGHSGKYMLYLWPEHCILGSEGHNPVGVVDEARMFHAYARVSQNRPEMKGQDTLTESYSVFSPEVTEHWNGKRPIAARNQRFLDHILSYQKILVAGQALSHCVQSSLDDLLAEIKRRDARLAGNVYILCDTMSSVVIPDGPDFTEKGEEALKRFAAAGMHIVRSTDPMKSWIY